MESLPVADLAEMSAPYNPRRISKHDLEALQRSIRYFGSVEPVVVNRRSNRIVGGHQRIKAAKAEGLESFPVVFVDLDDPSEKQLNLALNRITEFTGTAGVLEESSEPFSVVATRRKQDADRAA